jgi:parallel beta-helix repeat protein
VPAEYSTIQGAIFIAQNGDVVVVAPGHYSEAIDFKGKAITVRSTDPTDAAVVAATVIDAHGGAAAVVCKTGEGGGSVLTGFTITGATASGAAGIDCSAASSPRLLGNVIKGNVIGIKAMGKSVPLIEGNTISDNTDRGIVTDSAITVHQNTITRNGGGLKVEGAAMILYNVITNNVTTTDGGGVYCNFKGIQLQGNIIANNKTDGNGGGVCCVLETMLVANTIDSNSAGKAGGGVYAAAAAVVRNCIISSSVAGGGIAAAAADTPVGISFCNVWGNTGGEYVVLPDQTGQHGNISVDPLYAGGGDYHLKSQVGRWDPASQTWVKDAVSSPCIDAGDPNSPFNLEPAPNGSRANQGFESNTAEASMSNLTPEHAPKITAGPTAVPAPVVTGGQTQCSVTAEDDLGHALSYKWTATDALGAPAGSFDDDTSPTPKWTAPSGVTVPTRYTLRVVVTCSAGRTAHGQLQIDVTPTPADTVQITAGPTATPGTVEINMATACSVTAVDSLGHTLSYKWTATDTGGNPAGSFDDDTSPTPKWTAPATVGVYTLDVVVTCSKGKTAEGKVDVHVTPKPDVVQITAGPTATPATLAQGGQTQCTVTATDSLGHPLTYRWTAVDSAGHAAGSFDDATLRTPKWTAPATVPGESALYTLTVVVTCSQGQSAHKACTVKVESHQIKIVTGPSGDANPVLIGGQVRCRVVAQDNMGHPLTYFWGAVDSSGRQAGSFDDPRAASPVWTAPAGLSQARQAFTISVVVRCNQGGKAAGHYLQIVTRDPVGELSWGAGDEFVKSGVVPQQGVPGTPFSFRVRYLHTGNVAPQRVLLRVWRQDGTELNYSPYVMTAGGSDWRTGVTFSRSVRLWGHGACHYKFIAEVGSEVLRLPQTGWKDGPTVDIPPTGNWVGQGNFVADGVHPDSAMAGTQFVFKVKYSDQNGDPAAWVRLWIWAPSGGLVAGSPFSMATTNHAPDWKAGVVFQRALVLNAVGTLRYRFELSDGGPGVLFPAGALQQGPVITPAGSVSVAGVSGQQADQGLALTYTLGAPAEVEMTVLNLAGRTIAVISAGPQAAGVQTLRWNGRNLAGSLVPAGMYLVRVSARSGDGKAAQAVAAVNLRR